MIGEFEAGLYSTPKDVWSNLKYYGKKMIKNQLKFEENLAANQRKSDFAVEQRDIPLHYLYIEVLHNPSKENQQKLMDELAKRMGIEDLFNKVFPSFMADVKAGAYPPNRDVDCYRGVIEEFRTECGEIDEYAVKYFGAFVAQCNAQRYYPAAKDDFKAKLKEHCRK